MVHSKSLNYYRQSSGLNRSNARINLLRAMGSPEYVAFMAGEDKHYDPIHRVFVLTHEIKMVCNIIRNLFTGLVGYYYDE